MSDESEDVVIEHVLEDVPTAPRHVHHNRVVTCKKGEQTITLGPITKVQGDQTVGHEKGHRYVRTADVDSIGRAIFREERV